MDFNMWIRIGYTISGVLFGTIPTIIAFWKARNAKKNAKTAEEKAQADAKLEETAVNLIQEAEKFFANLDATLKSTTGESAGKYKKESVMSKLQQFAINNNITFDPEYWSKKVDAIVTLTKNVNCK